MSRKKRKYERIEALFSKFQPIVSDSPLPAASEDLTGSAEETKARPSTGDPHSVSVVPTAFVPHASGRQAFLTGIGLGQKMGFAYDHEQAVPLGESPLPPPENALIVPLMVSGTTIGAIQAAGNDTGWTAPEIEIVSAVAAQLERHLAKLRLLKR